MLKLRTRIIFLFIFLLIVALNMVLVYFEKEAGSGIDTLSDAFWYMIVTLTTVGYGDLYPASTGGKVIGYIYVFASLGILGFIFSSISSKVQTMLEEKRLGHRGTDFENHVIFYGWNDFSKLVAEEVISAQKKIAILTDKKDDVELIYELWGKEKVFVLFSDMDNPDLFDRLNAKYASVIFVALENDADSLTESIDIHRHLPEIDLVVSLKNNKLKETFRAAGVTYVVAQNEIVSKLVASYIFEPDVADLNLDLISSARNEHDFDNQEYEVLENNPYIGQNCHEVFFSLKKDHDVVLMGISKLKNGKRTVYGNPSREMKVELGDFLIIMTNNETMSEFFGVHQGRMS
ncbi:MAG: ion channel [Cytophagales bacterium]|nr:ion channel [Cytophagales bacterium]